jgi:hypothetical protein
MAHENAKNENTKSANTNCPPRPQFFTRPIYVAAKTRNLMRQPLKLGTHRCWQRLRAFWFSCFRDHRCRPAGPRDVPHLSLRPRRVDRLLQLARGGAPGRNRQLSRDGGGRIQSSPIEVNAGKRQLDAGPVRRGPGSLFESGDGKVWAPLSQVLLCQCLAQAR